MKEATIMKPETALKLYEIEKNSETQWLSLCRQTSQQYFVLVASLFTVSVAAIYALWDKNVYILFAAIGFLFNVGLCYMAIKAYRRVYRRFLECVTIQTKLLPFVGLLNRSNEDVAKTAGFHNSDKHFIPERWIKSHNESTADKFVLNNLERGGNHLIKISFFLLLIANFVLALLILLYAVQRSQHKDFIPSVFDFFYGLVFGNTFGI